jgi:hypothetical protein
VRADEGSTIQLRRLAPWAAWLKHNFSLPSVLTIAGVLGSALLYIVNLRTRVVVLEHEVTHIVQVAPDQVALAAAKERLADHEQRIGRLERDWDDARELAGTAPRPRGRR